MTEQEKELIKGFIANKKMSDAVQKYMMRHIAPAVDNETKGWVFGVDDQLSNDAFGEQVRGIRNGLILVERAFSEMRLIKMDDDEEKAETIKVRI